MKYSRPLSALITLGLLCGAASASTVLTESCTGISGSTELGGTIVCPQFDSSLGTLTSIDLTLNGEITGSITLTNNAHSSETVQGTTSSSFLLNTPLDGFSFPTPLFITSFTTGATTIPTATTQPFTSLDSGLNSVTDTDISSFANYEGLGTFGIDVATDTTFALIGGGGNVSSVEITNGAAGASLSFNYDVAQTPEPATFALYGSGLIGLSILRRRKRL